LSHRQKIAIAKFYVFEPMNAFFAVVVTTIISLTFMGCAKEQPKVTVSPTPTKIAPSPSQINVKEAGKYRQIGIQERDRGRYPQAIQALEKAVELDPQNLSGRVILGWTLHFAKQEQFAASALQEALERDPNYVPALNALGIVYLVSGNLQAAVTTHTKAIQLNPKNEVAYYNLCLAYHRLQQYDEAIAKGKQATVLEPNNPHPWVALAIAYWDKGEKSLAQQSYSQAIALDSRYRERWFLAHLEQAGFSAEQIQLSGQVLAHL
jgi:tetratricopeptide (TPR) repeat protein